MESANPRRAGACIAARTVQRDHTTCTRLILLYEGNPSSSTRTAFFCSGLVIETKILCTIVWRFTSNVDTRGWLLHPNPIHVMCSTTFTTPPHLWNNRSTVPYSRLLGSGKSPFLPLTGGGGLARDDARSISRATLDVGGNDSAGAAVLNTEAWSV